MCSGGKIMPRIPIFITVRGNTKERIEFNKELLNFSYAYINKANLFDQTYIISDNNELIEYAKELGFVNHIYYPCESQKDLLYLEFFAIYRYGVENNYHPDWFIILSPMQIFKTTNLLVDCINNIDDEYDIIASYSEVSDRKNFIIDETLGKFPKDHLLSSEVKRVRMADAAVYAIKVNFAYECMEHEDPSIQFWNGKIKYIKNDSVYTDVNSIDDIKKYYRIMNILDTTKNMRKKEPN